MIALGAAKAMKMDFAGIDILESDEGFVVSEINAAPNWSGLQKATGVDAAEEIVDYIIHQLQS